jgi:hypothetical protein
MTVVISAPGWEATEADRPSRPAKGFSEAIGFVFLMSIGAEIFWFEC